MFLPSEFQDVVYLSTLHKIIQILNTMGDIAQSIKYDVQDVRPTPHLKQIVETWSRVNSLTKSGSVTINGESLDVASVVAVARLVYA